MQCPSKPALSFSSAPTGCMASSRSDIIREILASSEPLESKCHALIDAAKSAGGPDNITAVLLPPSDPRQGYSRPATPYLSFVLRRACFAFKSWMAKAPLIAPVQKANGRIAVQLTDETGRPLEGVAVSFRMPEEGPGGSFESGMKTEIAITAADGTGCGPRHSMESHRGSLSDSSNCSKGRIARGRNLLPIYFRYAGRQVFTFLRFR